MCVYVCMYNHIYIYIYIILYISLSLSLLACTVGYGSLGLLVLLFGAGSFLLFVLLGHIFCCSSEKLCHDVKPKETTGDGHQGDQRARQDHCDGDRWVEDQNDGDHAEKAEPGDHAATDGRKRAAPFPSHSMSWPIK